MNARQPLTHEQALDLAPLYVLGALEEAEMASVREHLATCPGPTPSSRSWAVSCRISSMILRSSSSSRRRRWAIGSPAAAAADLAARTTVAASEPRRRLRNEPPRSRNARRPAPPVPTAAGARGPGRSGPVRTSPRVGAPDRGRRRDRGARARGTFGSKQVGDLERQVAAPRASGPPSPPSSPSPPRRAARRPSSRRSSPAGRAASLRLPPDSIQFAMEDLAPTSGSRSTRRGRSSARRRRYRSAASRSTRRGRRLHVEAGTDRPGVVVAVSRATGGWRDDTDRCRLGRSRRRPDVGRRGSGASAGVVSSEPRPSARAAQRRLRRGDDRLAVGPVGREAGHPAGHRDAPPADLGQLGDAVEDAPRDGRSSRAGRHEDELVAAERATVSTSRTAPASTTRPTEEPRRRLPGRRPHWSPRSRRRRRSRPRPRRPAAGPPSRAQPSTRANVRWLARPVSGSMWARRSNHSDRSAIVEARRDRSTATATMSAVARRKRRRHQRAAAAPRPAEQHRAEACSIPPRPTMSG